MPVSVDTLVLFALLPAERESVREARALIRLVARRLRCAADDLTLIASELVTNAIRHAGVADVGLQVRAAGALLFIEVIDQVPGKLPDIASIALPGDDDESGRGLWMVRALDCVRSVESCSGDASKTVTAVVELGLCA